MDWPKDYETRSVHSLAKEFYPEWVKRLTRVWLRGMDGVTARGSTTTIFAPEWAAPHYRGICVVHTAPYQEPDRDGSITVGRPAQRRTYSPGAFYHRITKRGAMHSHPFLIAAAARRMAVLTAFFLKREKKAYWLFADVEHSVFRRFSVRDYVPVGAVATAIVHGTDRPIEAARPKEPKP